MLWPWVQLRSPNALILGHSPNGITQKLLDSPRITVPLHLARHCSMALPIIENHDLPESCHLEGFEPGDSQTSINCCDDRESTSCK